MSLRQSFEKLFPVPEWVRFDESRGLYMSREECDASHQQNAWMTPATFNMRKQGFQAGRAAGLEDAAVCAWSWLMDHARRGGVTPAIDTRFGVCDAIRAMKS